MNYGLACVLDAQDGNIVFWIAAVFRVDSMKQRIHVSCALNYNLLYYHNVQIYFHNDKCSNPGIL